MTDQFQVSRGLKTLFVSVSAATLLLAAGCNAAGVCFLQVRGTSKSETINVEIIH